MSVSNKEKWDFCHNLSIVDVCRDISGIDIDTRRKSTKSPFRSDSGKNAFTIDIQRNIFADWGLPVSDNKRGIVSGDPIDFVRYYFSLRPQEAVEYLWSRYHGENYSAVQHKTVTLDKSKEHAAPDLSKEELNVAYSVFLGLSSLDDRSLSYLKNRNFTEDDITYYGFKTFPKRTIKGALNKALRGYNIRPESVPGLYLRKGDADASFNFYDAVILPVRTVRGSIEGLQIRFFNPGDGPKYIWFSSDRFTYPDYVYDGKTPGTPIGFVDREIKNDSTLFITEGLFKAISINKCYKCPVLTVQGVGNFSGIDQELNYVLEKYPNIKRILIAYDADFIGNINVTSQAVRLYKTLQETYPNLRYQYVSWDEKYGKGFDDLIETTGGWNVKDIVKTIEMQKFASTAEEIMPQARELWMDGKRKEIANLFKSRLFN